MILKELKTPLISSTLVPLSFYESMSLNLSKANLQHMKIISKHYRLKLAVNHMIRHYAHMLNLIHCTTQENCLKIWNLSNGFANLQVHVSFSSGSRSDDTYKWKFQQLFPFWYCQGMENGRSQLRELLVENYLAYKGLILNKVTLYVTLLMSHTSNSEMEAKLFQEISTYSTNHSAVISWKLWRCILWVSIVGTGKCAVQYQLCFQPLL